VSTEADRVDREQQVTEAFVGLADSLVGPFDSVDLLDRLTQDCARLLDVASAGLLLADRHGVLHVVAASSERTRDLELFQLQRDEGPCLECYRSGRPVSVDDLSQRAARWPQFVPAALTEGFESVHAIPMRLLDDVLGALGLFGTSTGALNEADLRLGQAMAHVASVAVAVGAAAAEKGSVTDHLYSILKGRVVVEQAKGILAFSEGFDMEEAFAMLRRYANHHGERLTDVAQACLRWGCHPLLLAEAGGR
jgi:transcriptional regulator with GAF, ATPase, and Fis domain